MGNTSPKLDKWTFPESLDDLRHVFEPNAGVHILYKHSNSCGICFFSKKSIESLMQNRQDAITYHFVEVRQSRDLSNFIEQQTGVRHESPQALLIYNGVVLWQASHGSITEAKLEEALEKVKFTN